MNEAAAALSEFKPSATGYPTPPNFRDLTGRRIGFLTVLSRAPNGTFPSGGWISRWNCVCDCGQLTVVRGATLIRGATKSCGCHRGDKLVAHSLKHGMTGTRTHRCWKAMKCRCTNPSSTGFRFYGGRGIRVCERWQQSFMHFLDDMGECPDRLHSLDRIDPNGNYEPSNCRWATRLEQGRNTRANRFIELDGEVLCLAEWSARSGVGTTTIGNRLKWGWDTREAIFTITEEMIIKEQRAHGN